MKHSESNLLLNNEWRVSPTEGVLSRGNEIVHLEPKAMDVLIYFASRPGEVISREELERDVWSGAVVGYDAITNTVIKLRKALQDNARHPDYIATIPKKGYQLIASVTYPGDHESEIDTSKLLINQSRKALLSWPTHKTGIATLAGIFVFALISLWPSTSSVIPVRNSAASPQSIVVLPFDNIGDDPKQEYIANGITQDIITDLSRLSNVLVISSNTSSTYKGKKISSIKVGTDLNVNFVLKGSIQQFGDAIRVNVQLVNSMTGFNVWAQRYDRNLTEVFSVQDEVTDSIVKALTVKITNQEKRRLAQRATASLKAYDYFQEGQKISMLRTKESFKQAREAYQKAISLDPNYGRAYGAMAITLIFDYQRGWVETPTETLDRAQVLAKKAVSLDNSTPQTYWALSFIYLTRKEYDKAEKAITEAIRIAPNYADGYGLHALIKMYLGQPQQALELNKKGMQLNPFYSWQYLFTHGSAYYMKADYNSAITELEKAQGRNQNAIQVKLFLAASYIKAGRLNDAQWMIDEIQALNPTATISDIEKTIPIADTSLKLALLDDLRKAGLPE
ncbi:MAG: winged helix-turn-helix domain-containing protein [Gammaproteobacteria bacterium]|nr:winged helix-turn-helix domain-containing protein [Gammaproteobacteria bacterium]